MPVQPVAARRSAYPDETAPAGPSAQPQGLPQASARPEPATGIDAGTRRRTGAPGRRRATAAHPLAAAMHRLDLDRDAHERDVREAAARLSGGSSFRHSTILNDAYAAQDDPDGPDEIDPAQEAILLVANSRAIQEADADLRLVDAMFDALRRIRSAGRALTPGTPSPMRCCIEGIFASARKAIAARTQVGRLMLVNIDLLPVDLVLPLCVRMMETEEASGPFVQWLAESGADDEQIRQDAPAMARVVERLMDGYADVHAELVEARLSLADLPGADAARDFSSGDSTLEICAQAYNAVQHWSARLIALCPPQREGARPGAPGRRAAAAARAAAGPGGAVVTVLNDSGYYELARVQVGAGAGAGAAVSAVDPSRSYRRNAADGQFHPAPAADLEPPPTPMARDRAAFLHSRLAYADRLLGQEAAFDEAMARCLSLCRAGNTHPNIVCGQISGLCSKWRGTAERIGGLARLLAVVAQREGGSEGPSRAGAIAGRLEALGDRMAGEIAVLERPGLRHALIKAYARPVAAQWIELLEAGEIASIGAPRGLPTEAGGLYECRIVGARREGDADWPPVWLHVHTAASWPVEALGSLAPADITAAHLKSDRQKNLGRRWVQAQREAGDTEARVDRAAATFEQTQAFLRLALQPR